MKNVHDVGTSPLHTQPSGKRNSSNHTIPPH